MGGVDTGLHHSVSRGGAAQGNTGDPAYKPSVRVTLAKFCGKSATLIPFDVYPWFTSGGSSAA
ncbi:hypothetical protein F6A13_10325 [Acidithiobacillus sp. 'AMD consortium']|uniref:Uncharacterized protein n=1 Tax=Acidithiobacillus ferrooxidans TaxID=920 RepID=A0A2W1KP77_ACIFR|nr:hypothetical protein DN052_08555 [Acidithiobacillus ferrooxidans]QFG78979.1 hypothetical protein F6A13_10325 [Acidithiobacillus sp. 'AMD consortium']QLK42785.1 hypothetical protein FE661_12070 [Acidithiobacillus ferrooxidans]RRN82772.1 MAG: hypothetical protein EC577_10270 [Acidithiobacillus ferrooxidans]